MWTAPQITALEKYEHFSMWITFSLYFQIHNCSSKNRIIFLRFEYIFCEMVNYAENKCLKTIYSTHLKRGRNDTKVADIFNMYLSY
jgi:hypothetical protein